MKEVIKGLRLYDYNRDGYIQKKELRNVLENYCFKMNDQQFDKYIHISSTMYYYICNLSFYLSL